jgi:hypothetical protein
MVALPLHFPEDPAIQSVRSGQVLIPNGSVAPFVHEPSLLQRERKDGVPGWLWGVMYGAVIAAWMVLLALYGWCYTNAGRPGGVAASVRERVHT